MSKFTDWLSNQLLDRKMSQRELARRGNISPTIVGNVLSGKQEPRTRFCVAIAHALELPTDDVLAIAELGKDTPTKEYTEMPELFDIASELTDQQYHDAVALLDMLKRGVIVVKAETTK